MDDGSRDMSTPRPSPPATSTPPGRAGAVETLRAVERALKATNLVLQAGGLSLVALDLAGDEAHWPGDLFIEHFRKARSAGWHITVHAGESAGAQSIWQAVRQLGADRLGHAVRAIDDPALMDELARLGVGIESNLTSNVQTSTVPDYASHPLRAFLERGLLASINTDDPGISAITLPHEYNIAAPLSGLSKAQILQAQKYALEVAFLSPQEKEALIKRKATMDEGSPGNLIKPRNG